MVNKILGTAAALCLCLLGSQSAQAIQIVASSGTIAAGQPIHFDLPTDVGGGLAGGAGSFTIDFLVDGQPGHILLFGPTTLNIHAADGITGLFGGLVVPVSYELGDMNNNALANTDRSGDVLALFGGLPQNPVGAQTPVNDPINPADLENGQYFHFINFDVQDIPNLQIQSPNAALVFNQDVELGVWVPEPGTYAALASLGLVGLCVGYRRRKANRK